MDPYLRECDCMLLGCITHTHTNELPGWDLGHEESLMCLCTVLVQYILCKLLVGALEFLESIHMRLNLILLINCFILYSMQSTRSTRLFRCAQICLACSICKLNYSRLCYSKLGKRSRLKLEYKQQVINTKTQTNRPTVVSTDGSSYANCKPLY